jgi:hypothetical protein
MAHRCAMQTRMVSATGERVHISSRDRLITVIPYLLGFFPSNSAVLVWTEADLVVLTMRVDLPSARDQTHPGTWASEVLGAAVHSRSRAVHIIVFMGDDAACGVAGQSVMVDLVRAAELLDIHVESATTVNGDRIFPDACEECEGLQCSGHARPADPQGNELFRFHFPAPALSRDAALEEFLHSSEEGDLSPYISRHLGPRNAARTARMGHASLETWRDDIIGAVLAIAARSPEPSPVDPLHSPDDIARVVVALGDIRCRDAVLWAWSMPGQDLRVLGDLLAAAARRAPSGMVAGPATVLAVIMWLRGDGLRAKAACQRALECDPDYSLAVLLDAALGAGLPPGVWREVVGDLSYAECRGEVPSPTDAVAERAGSPS